MTGRLLIDEVRQVDHSKAYAVAMIAAQLLNGPSGPGFQQYVSRAYDAIAAAQKLISMAEEACTKTTE